MWQGGDFTAEMSDSIAFKFVMERDQGLAVPSKLRMINLDHAVCYVKKK